MNFFAILKQALSVSSDVQRKGWYTSKTVWFNVLSLVAALVAIKGYNIDANDVSTIATGVVTVVNIVLRFGSQDAIGVTKADGAEVPPPA